MASRGRKCSHPWSCAASAPSGRPECVSRTIVPSPSEISSIVTVEEPGGSCSSPSHPQVNTTRWGTSTSTYSPTACFTPVTFTRYTPPGDASNVASTPFHRTIFCGCVRKGKIASGAASILISLLTVNVPAATSSPFLGFHFVLQRREATRPERLEGGLQLGEGVAVRPIQAAGAVSTFRDETDGAQDRQVLRDR